MVAIARAAYPAPIRSRAGLPQYSGSLAFTRHAQVRMHQRALGRWLVQLIPEFGEMYYAGSGCTAFFIGRRVAKRLSERLGISLDVIRDTAVIEGRDGAIVTVAHRVHPGRAWKHQ